MRNYRSMNHKAANLAESQVIEILEDGGGITIKGCNPIAEGVILGCLEYVVLNDGSLRLRIRRGSLAQTSGAQFRFPREVA